MRTIAFIFARGGSKGLPNKNIKLLNGIPLIGHSILLAKEIKEIDQVYVSTESSKIKEISLSYGAKIINRPKKLAEDDSPEWLSWRHAINWMKKEKIACDCFVSLPTTSPLRSKEDIISCIECFKKGSQMVITVTKANRKPDFNMISRNEKGISTLLKKGKYSRRQDAPEIYDITTVAYVTSPKNILKNDNIFSGDTNSVIIPKERAIDIDDEIDFLIAETLYDKYKRTK